MFTRPENIANDPQGGENTPPQTGGDNGQQTPPPASEGGEGQEPPAVEPPSSEPPQQFDFGGFAKGLGVEANSPEEFAKHYSDIQAKYNEAQKTASYWQGQDSQMARTIAAAELNGKDAMQAISILAMDTENMSPADAMYQKWYMENAKFVDASQARDTFAYSNPDLALYMKAQSLQGDERAEFLEDNGRDANWLNSYGAYMQLEGNKAKAYLQSQKQELVELGNSMKPQQQSNPQNNEQLAAFLEDVKKASQAEDFSIKMGENEVNIGRNAWDDSQKQLFNQMAQEPMKMVDFLLDGSPAEIARLVAMKISLSNPNSANEIGKNYMNTMDRKSIESLLDNPPSPNGAVKGAASSGGRTFGFTKAF